MTASEAKMRYMDAYNKENYEKITLQVKKGIRDLWRGYANERGLSMARFISEAVDNYIRKEVNVDET